MTSSPANWTNLFLPKGGSVEEPEEGIDIWIDEDEVTEVTANMMVALPEAEEELDAEFEDVTDSLEPLDAELASEAVEAWPKSFEEHLAAVRKTLRKGVDDRTKALLGLSYAAGCERTTAAIAKAWEDLEFWEPMLELGRNGEFSGHLTDLRKCMALLEANPPPSERPELLEKWERARAAVRRNLPGSGIASVNDIGWQQRVARGRNARVTMLDEGAA